MNKKIVLWVLMFFFVVAPTLAIDWDDCVAYYSFDDDDINSTHAFDLVSGAYNLTVTSATSGASCVLDECYSYDGNDDFLQSSSDPVTVKSVAFWGNTSSYSSSEAMYVSWSTGGVFYSNSVGALTLLDDGDTGQTANAVASDNVFQFIVINYGDGVEEIWVDGVNKTLSTNTLGNSAFDTGGNIVVGRYNLHATLFHKGHVDELSYWNRTLTSSEISELYNSGSGLAYSGGGGASNFTVNLTPSYPFWDDELNCTHDANINGYDSFTFDWYNDGNSLSLNQSTLNNTYFNISQDLICEVYAINNTDSTNATINSTSVTILAPNVTYNNILNSSSIYPMTLTANYSIDHENETTRYWVINGSTVQTNNDTFNSWLDSYLGQDIFHQLKIEVPAQNYTFLQNSSSKTIGQTIFFNATNLVNASISVENFTINYSAGSFTATGNNLTIYNYNETDTYTFSHPDYATQSINLTTNVTSQNYEWQLYTINSIDFNFYEEETKNPLNFLNVTVELISNLYSSNYTTSNGTLYLDLITPEDYTIRYSAPGYPERFYYFTLQNTSYNNLTLYSLNSTLGSNITATVYDEASRPIENAIIKALRYDIATNTYILVEMAQTNFEGETFLTLVEDDEFYYFVIEYPIGTIKKTTDPTYILSTDIQFQIVVGGLTGESFFQTQQLNYNLSYNNATNRFIFTYVDSTNTLSEACLEVYRLSAIDSTGNTLINRSCSSTSAGTILIDITPVNGTSYRAYALTSYSPEDYLDTMTHTVPLTTDFGVLGLFVIFLLTVAFAFIFFWRVSIALVLVPLPMVIGSFIGLITIDRTIMIGIEALMILAAFIISKYD